MVALKLKAVSSEGSGNAVSERPALPTRLLLPMEVERERELESVSVQCACVSSLSREKGECRNFEKMDVRENDERRREREMEHTERVREKSRLRLLRCSRNSLRWHKRFTSFPSPTELATASHPTRTRVLSAWSGVKPHRPRGALLSTTGTFIRRHFGRSNQRL